MKARGTKTLLQATTRSVKFSPSARNEHWDERLLTKQAGEEETRSPDIRRYVSSSSPRHSLPRCVADSSSRSSISAYPSYTAIMPKGPQPLGISGKSTQDMVRELDALARRGEASRSSWQGASAVAIERENEERAARYTARLDRRDGGDEAVSDDELFIDLDGNEIPADDEGTGETLKNPADILADATPLATAIHGMSLSSKAAFMKAFQVLTDTHIPSKEAHIRLKEAHTGPKEAHTAAKEVIDASEQAGFEIPPAVLKLASAQIHIPLTLVTSNAIRRMHLDPTSLWTRKLTTNSGSRVDIIDLARWPEEESLPVGLFTEAWKNLLKVYRKLADKEIIELFQTHYDYITSLLHFYRVYKAILRFDCEVRRTWMNEPSTFSPEDAKYQNCLEKIQVEMMREGYGAEPYGTCDSSNRFRPYPRSEGHTRNGGKRAPERSKPFREGK
ncbi:uncharacterized protein LAESUDRAFT_754780 [Laetiporus sulphureus 93-53]|uniref:Uncharacterized protein n=1 Tax=Laetiporus sulphureus 93-53 TaxID=1314785 RepID=A0A165HX90_9APHY|nr:uncharacterized protein LAESUDRAFT_754780 [Laetiporus sulphureus 93-53]KZT12309.1 hypothetical protein LAESUDRAFT_754780 [Laetiporus sulphureus 93-53]